jgi:hypothetical protein
MRNNLGWGATGDMAKQHASIQRSDVSPGIAQRRA